MPRERPVSPTTHVAITYALKRGQRDGFARWSYHVKTYYARRDRDGVRKCPASMLVHHQAAISTFWMRSTLPDVYKPWFEAQECPTGYRVDLRDVAEFIKDDYFSAIRELVHENSEHDFEDDFDLE